MGADWVLQGVHVAENSHSKAKLFSISQMLCRSRWNMSALTLVCVCVCGRGGVWSCTFFLEKSKICSVTEGHVSIAAVISGSYSTLKTLSSSSSDHVYLQEWPYCKIRCDWINLCVLHLLQMNSVLKRSLLSQKSKESTTIQRHSFLFKSKVWSGTDRFVYMIYLHLFS